MALITIINRPDDYSFSRSRQYWAVRMDDTSTNYITATIYVNAGVVITFKLYPVPTERVVYLDVQKVISNIVKYQFYNYDNIADNVSEELATYTIDFLADNDTAAITDTANVVHGSTDLFTDTNIILSDYVLVSGMEEPVKFYNLKPTFYTNEYADENLFFINKDVQDLQIKIIAFYNDGTSGVTILGTNNAIPIVTSDGYRIKVKAGTVKYLTLSTSLQGLIKLNVSISTLSAAGILSMDNLTKYSIVLLSADGTQLSEYRTFFYKPINCSIPILNLYFEGKLGTTETIQLINPVYDLTTSDNIVADINPLSFSGGNVLRQQSDIFNADKKVISINKETTITAYTPSLSNDVNKWLGALAYSPNIYVKIDGLFVPCQADFTSWNYKSSRFADDSNVKEIKITLPQEFTPDHV